MQLPGSYYLEVGQEIGAIFRNGGQNTVSRFQIKPAKHLHMLKTCFVPKRMPSSLQKQAGVCVWQLDVLACST